MGSKSDEITQGWKEAMRSGDSLRRDTLSMLRAAIKNTEIEARGPGAESVALNDAGVMKVIEREAKKRRDAIDEHEKAGRADRAEAERRELAILQEFLPAPLTDEELETLVGEVVQELGAGGMKDMGRVMQTLTPRIAGRADGKRASEAVRKQLTQ